jgi:hypothetical protein
MEKMATVTGMIPTSFQRLIWTTKRMMLVMKSMIKTKK